MTQKTLKPHKCEVCDKQISCYLDTIGRLGRRKDSHRSRGARMMMESKDGVYFNGTNKGGAWFCNECWSLILKGVTVQPKDL